MPIFWHGNLMRMTMDAAHGFGSDFNYQVAASSPTAALMPKSPTIQQGHSWAIYHIKSAKFVGIILDAPDEQTATSLAIEEYQVSPNKRGQLVVHRRRDYCRITY